MVKRALKDLVLSSPNPGGPAFPASSVLIEPPHLRRDKSRPGDIMALGRDIHRLDIDIDLVIASGLTKSCLPSSCKSSESSRESQIQKGHELSPANLVIFYDAISAVGS